VQKRKDAELVQLNVRIPRALKRQLVIEAMDHRMELQEWVTSKLSSVRKITMGPLVTAPKGETSG
jgi:predicted HicB family RNase H-like nuclease